MTASAAGTRTAQRATDPADGAIELARRVCPNVILMDIRMPELDGIEATRRICGDPATADVRVLILTTFDLDEYVYAALRAGASGFLLKDTPPADLLSAIRTVAQGDALLAPSVTRRLIAEFARRPEPAQSPVSRLDGLTELLAKLHARDRAQLVITAYETGLVTAAARG